MSITQRFVFPFLSFCSLVLVTNASPLSPPSNRGSNGTGWAPITSTSIGDSCGIRRYSKADMQASGVYDWLRGELTVFTSAAKDNEEFVKDYLIPHYAPKVTPQMTRCWVSRDCDIISSCEDLKVDLPIKTKEYAFNVFMGISNLNAMFHDILGATDVAGLGMALGKEVLAETFTYADELDEYEDRVVHDTGMSEKSIMYMINAIFSAADALNPVSLPGITKGGLSFSVDPFSALKGVWGAVFSMYLFEQSLKPEPKDQTTDHELVATRYLSDVLYTDFMATRETFSTSSREIMKGSTLGNTNIDMLTFLEAGDFTKSTLADTKELEHKTMNAWYSAVIGQLWETERIYGLEVDVLPDSSCEADNRGPESVKVCLPEHPQSIFFFYGIPKFEERSRDHVSTVYPIPGWDKFRGAGFMGITQHDIARSSKNYWDRHDNARDLDLRPSIVADPIAASNTTYGMFRVPMCRDARGVYISSIYSGTGNTYPCDCAESKALPNYDLDSRIQRNALFMHATKFRWSYDYNDMCSRKEYSRMHCETLGDEESLQYYYPKGDLGPGIEESYCWRSKGMAQHRPAPREHCFAVSAFTNCWPGTERLLDVDNDVYWYSGDGISTNVVGTPILKPKPMYRGYGI